MKRTIILTSMLYLLMVLPFAYWILGVNQNFLGVEPIVKMNTQSGLVALILLEINLLIGCLNGLKWLNIKFPYRKELGISCGAYFIIHFLTYLGKESFMPKAWEQIITKKYLIAGSLSGVIILLLTITSNQFATRLLKQNWKKLHRLVYIAWIVMHFHIFLIEKNNLIFFAMGMFPVTMLLIWRFFAKIRGRPLGG